MHADFRPVVALPETSWRYEVLRQRAFEFSWHFHREFELVLITRGTGTRIIGDRIESYRAGDLTLIGSNMPHAYVSTPGTSDQEAILVQFRRDFLGTEFFSRPEFAATARLLDPTASATIFEARNSVVDRCHALADLDPPGRTLAMLELLTTLAGDERARPLARHAPFDGLSRAARRRVDVVCAHLQTAYAGEVRLADVAELAHLSPTAFSRFFRRALGRTMTQYVTELRIAAACQLLRDSDLAVTAIAARCGYDNLSNFNRRFRALMNRSPREYRRAVTAAQEPDSPRQGREQRTPIG